MQYIAYLYFTSRFVFQASLLRPGSRVDRQPEREEDLQTQGQGAGRVLQEMKTGTVHLRSSFGCYA